MKICKDCGKSFRELPTSSWCEDCFDKGLHKDMNDHFDNYMKEEMKVTTDAKPRTRKEHDPKIKLAAIFSKTIKTNDCLEWTGNYFKNGKKNWQYPYMYYKSKVWRGNRLVLFLHTGQLPEGMYALHTCDNNKCVNPEHLYWGTPKQNVADSYSRGRAYNTKVTHCAHGHEYTPENTAIGTRSRGTYRLCKECRRTSGGNKDI